MIEGPVPVCEVLAAGAILHEVYVDAEAWATAGPGSSLRTAVDGAAQGGAPIWSLEPGVLARLSDTVTPQGLLAVAPRRTVTLAEVCARTGPVLVLVDVADPGNLGTLVRAAEAAGAAGVVVAGSSTDPFGPKAVRAAAGSLLRLPIAEVTDAVDAVTAIHAAGRLVVATTATGGSAPDALDLTGPVAVVIGSEAHGLPDAVVARAGVRSTIPLAAPVESLNAAVAGAIVLFEVERQRRGVATGEQGTIASGTDWTTDSLTDRLGDR